MQGWSMPRILADEVVDRQCEVLRSGAAHEKLAVLNELTEASDECRARADQLPRAAFKEPGVREKYAPWLEFRKILGEPLFEAIVEIARQERPSPVRALAGDILAQLWHPAAIGRLLEAFESRLETLSENPPLRIFLDLGGIGTEAAVKALMWLWGTEWDADAAGALGMCDSGTAQDFLLANASVHPDPYVRSICLAHLRPPITKEKADLFIARLFSGTQSERFIAAMKVKEFRLAAAVPALISARARKDDEALMDMIDEALAVLRGGR
ncbi:MAG TPA: hypothetical protein DCZ92_14620 [Elusimicrobia bacterium]|nr:hypothetical protein [Elusimicrobiota bacterium]